MVATCRQQAKGRRAPWRASRSSDRAAWVLLLGLVAIQSVGAILGSLIASSRGADSATATIIVEANGTTRADLTLDAPSLIVVTGRPEVFFPSASVANLDAGLLVGGNTRWDHDGDGIIFNETYGGFLWEPTAGLRIFDISDELYWTPSFYTPVAIADDETVAGTTIFRTLATTAPWQWTADQGLEFLPLPAATGWCGSVAAISHDGRVVGGTTAAGDSSAVAATRRGRSPGLTGS